MVLLSGPAIRAPGFSISSDVQRPRLARQRVSPRCNAISTNRRSLLRYVFVENGSQRKCVGLAAEHTFVLKRGRGSYLLSALPIMDLDDFQIGVKDPDGLRSRSKILMNLCEHVLGQVALRHDLDGEVRHSLDR